MVAYFGNVDPAIEINKLDNEKYKVVVSAASDVENVNITTEDGIAMFTWDDSSISPDENVPTHRKSFSMKADKKYEFVVTGENNVTESKISIIDQKRGYSNTMYLMSIF